MRSTPITAVSLFRAVMTAAEWRCQCTGACGQTHAKSDGRCPREHDGYVGKNSGPVRLTAAPPDPLTNDLQAAALPAGELRAWCPTCLTTARTRAHKTRAAGTPSPEGLFDL
ncbi:hypothetical protein [Streptomyces celluloflavus]|uniref:hypothetical protein n=1 Tax=Streptomyces celluloflavus TaxID=58344 RepID=UPI0036AF7D22